MARTCCQAPAEPDPLSDLARREREILELVAVGRSNKEAARQLKLSEKTIKHNMTNILQKLQIRNRVEAALIARTKPLIVSYRHFVRSAAPDKIKSIASETGPTQPKARNSGYKMKTSHDGDECLVVMTRSSAARTLRPSSVISASVMISGGAMTKQPASGRTITPSTRPAS